MRKEKISNEEKRRRLHLMGIDDTEFEESLNGKQPISKSKKADKYISLFTWIVETPYQVNNFLTYRVPILKNKMDALKEIFQGLNNSQIVDKALTELLKQKKGQLKKNAMDHSQNE